MFSRLSPGLTKPLLFFFFKRPIYSSFFFFLNVGIQVLLAVGCQHCFQLYHFLFSFFLGSSFHAAKIIVFCKRFWLLGSSSSSDDCDSEELDSSLSSYFTSVSVSKLDESVVLSNSLMALLMAFICSFLVK